MLELGEKLAGSALALEFEGVYHRAEVWLDGVRLCEHPYGYTGFLVDLTGLVEPGRPSELRVVARNSDQPNSRWYTGAGLYRPVTLWAGAPAHVEPDGIFVRTLGLDPARVEVGVDVTGAGTVLVEVFGTGPDGSPDGRAIARGEAQAPSAGRASVTLELPGARP